MPEGGSRALERMCHHCGATHTKHLGYCSVCEMAVCEKCGNTQFVMGERKVTHDLCLKDTGGGFTMIKFVR